MIQIMRSRVTETEFAVGDYVWLHRRAAGAAIEPRKWKPLYTGPYRITARHGKGAYQLNLPSNIKIRNPVSVEHLKEFHQRAGASGAGATALTPADLGDVADVFTVTITTRCARSGSASTRRRG